MASLSQLSYEEAKALPQNNKNARIRKFSQLSQFVPQNAEGYRGADGIIAKFAKYNVRRMNTALIAIVDVIDQSAPQSPNYGPRDPMDVDDPPLDAPPMDIDDPPMDIDDPPMDIDAMNAAPDVVLQQAAQSNALSNVVNRNAFLPYQRQVVAAINQINQMKPENIKAGRARQLRRVIQVVYEVFFGVDYSTGQPTAFYTEYGAAPIAGMNPTQLTTQATQARLAQKAVNHDAEAALGFLSTLLQPLFERASNDPEIGNALNNSWQQQGSNTGIAAPLNDIWALMQAVQNVHLAGAHLVRSDPLFIVNRSERVQQGDLRVRNWYERVGYWIALNGYASLRALVLNAPLGQQLAVRMDAAMPAAYRSPHIAIQQFEAALGEYNNVYKGLPPWARLCWTLPYPPGYVRYNHTLTRSENKPGAEGLKQAMALAQEGDTGRAIQTLRDARGNVLNNPAPTYPAFLTLTGNGDVDGPLIAYYYALHGGRMLYEQEGQEWLENAFNSNPGRFIQEMGQLVDTMEEMSRQYQASGRSGDGFFSQNQAWLNAVRALDSRNPGTRAEAERRVSGAFSNKQIGTIDTRAHTSAACRPGGSGSASFCQRFHPNPQQSSQQGMRPLRGIDVLRESGSGKQGVHEYRKNLAKEASRQVGAHYSQEQQDLAGEKVTIEFLKELRDGIENNNKNKYWSTSTRKSTQNPELTIRTPGILDILNIPVSLHAPIPRRRPTSPRSQQWTEVPREIAGTGHGPGLRLYQLLVRNLRGFRNINTQPALLQMLGMLGTGLITAARAGEGVDGFDNPNVRMFAPDVRKIALQFLQNPLLRAQFDYNENSANQAIIEINKKRGGRKTRKHKKRSKKTRNRRKRGKKTRHKRRKHTRKQ